MLPLENPAELKSLAVVGVGYVGLPLAMAFSKYYKVTAFDVNASRIQDYQNGIDHTGDFTAENLKKANVHFTSNPDDLKEELLFIVTVPTPVTKNNIPDPSHLISASSMLSRYLRAGSLVVYESTVYPTFTEDICQPLLENGSGLKLNDTLFLGYSPERIRPGDKKYTVETITKIVSGSTPLVTEFLAHVYGKMVKAGIHKATSIQVAESAKIVENIQRDVIIGLMNELAMLFHGMNIPFNDVLEAAGTKWDFVRLTPGFVGGHCISVDPYYLSYKAQELGFDTKMLLTARATNDEMPIFMAHTFIKDLLKTKGTAKRIGVLGFTFKENCPDIRNTQVVRLINEIEEFGAEVLIFDDWADAKEMTHEYGKKLSSWEEMKDLDGVFVAVGHETFKTIPADKWKSLFRAGETGYVFDFKRALNRADFEAVGIEYRNI